MHAFPSTQLVTAPAPEPFSTVEAKTHLRVDHSTEDTYIESLIIAARVHVEGCTNRALITQTWKAFYDKWPCHFLLPYAPLQSVTHVKYTDVAGTQTTLATTEYEVDTVREPGLIRLAYGKSWPSVMLKYTNPIEIQFVCGYGDDSTDIPMPIRQAMLLLIGHWYDNRDAVTIGNTAASVSEPLKLGVDALLASYRVNLI